MGKSIARAGNWLTGNNSLIGRVTPWNDETAFGRIATGGMLGGAGGAGLNSLAGGLKNAFDPGSPQIQGIGGDARSPIAQGWQNSMMNFLNDNRFANATNNLLSGRPTDPTNTNAFLARMQDLTKQQSNLPGVRDTYNAPNFNNPNFRTDFNLGENIPQLGDQVNINDLQNLIMGNNAANLFGRIGQAQTPDLMSGFGSQGNTGSNYMSPQSEALQAIADRRSQRDVADLRARFGVMGGTTGSPAAFAESQYRAEAMPQIINALAQADQGQQAINLQNQLGNRNLDLSQLQNISNFISGNRSLDVTQRGQDISAGQNNLNTLVESLLTGARINQTGALANQQSALAAGQMRNQALQGMNQDQLNLAQMLNNFNANNAQFGATFGQNADTARLQAMLQDQAQRNNFMLGVGGLGRDMNQQALQGQLGMLNNLFDSFNRAYGIGTTQAENLVQPGRGLQTLQALAGLLQGVGGIARGFG